MITGNRYLDRRFGLWRKAALMAYLYRQAESSPVVDAGRFDLAWPGMLNGLLDRHHRETLETLALRREHDSNYRNPN